MAGAREPQAPTRPTAVFRADACAAIGGGHVRRCLTLARALADAGWNSAFAVGGETVATVPALSASGLPVIAIPDDAGAEPAALADEWPDGADLLVVDHYGRDAVFERACRPWARHILAIDDLADRPHDCDLVLDQTCGRDAVAYAALVAADCRVLTGPRYALLRPEFAAARAETLARRAARGGAVSRILVALGTSDADNATGLVLDGIAGARLDVAVDVVLGAGAPHLEDVRRRVAILPRARLLTEIADMAVLMAEADLAVGAGGTTSWERCCLGLPSLLIVIADNQRQVVAGLAAGGAARSLGRLGEVAAGDVAASLAELAGNTAEVARMASSAAALCDGRGSERLLPHLAGTEQAHGGAVRLRAADIEDEATILEWQRATGARRYSRNPAPPTEEEHHRWLTAQLADTGRLPMIVTYGRRTAGLLRLDAIGGAAGEAEVSILIDSAYHGRGIGRAALRLARRRLPGWRLRAMIDDENCASLAVFRAAGYVREDGQWWLSAPAEGSSRATAAEAATIGNGTRP